MRVRTCLCVCVWEAKLLKSKPKNKNKCTTRHVAINCTVPQSSAVRCASLLLHSISFPPLLNKSLYTRSVFSASVTTRKAKSVCSSRSRRRAQTCKGVCVFPPLRRRLLLIVRGVVIKSDRFCAYFIQCRPVLSGIHVEMGIV